MLNQFKHCNFCGNFSLDLIACSECKKKVCMAANLGGDSCILKETIPGDMLNTFKCPECHAGPSSVRAFQLLHNHNWLNCVVLVGIVLRIHDCGAL